MRLKLQDFGVVLSLINSFTSSGITILVLTIRLNRGLLPSVTSMVGVTSPATPAASFIDDDDDGGRWIIGANGRGVTEVSAALFVGVITLSLGVLNPFIL